VKRAITRDDWKLHKMPKAHATIPANRRFSAEEMESIKLGFHPESMDDHWFIFYEKDQQWPIRGLSNLFPWRAEL
jgi:hypothetical protein